MVSEGAFPLDVPWMTSAFPRANSSRITLQTIGML
jgi:hypothetical protein